MSLKLPIPAWVGASVPLALAVWWWAGLLVRDYVEIGPDEGMEMAKALLLARAPEEAGQAWTDQPWLYARVLAGLWRWSGGDWLAGRLLSGCLAGLWMLAQTRLLPRGSTGVHGFWAGLFLLSWPWFLPLGCSMMVELPWMSLAILSLVLLGLGRCLNPGFCAVAAGLAGLAVSFKVVALMFLPAWMVALAYRESLLGEPRPPPASVWFRLGLWMAVFVLVVGSLLPWGIQGPDQGLIRSHWRSAQWLWQEAAGRFAFSPRFLLSAGVTLLTAGVGAWLLLRDGRGREGWVAGLLVVVPALVHWVHQPFWKFYLLHFAPGVAVLAGWGMGEVCLRVWRGLSTPASRAKPGCFLRSLMVAAALLAGWLNWDFARAVEDVRRIEGNPRRSESPLMEALQKVAPKVRYGYTRAPAFLAQANCLALPELTILPRKRFWSGDITESRIREIIRERQPEILLLREEGEAAEPAWQEILTAFYVHILTDRGLRLYMHHRLKVSPSPGSLERLRELGQ
jgi:hypothetical protein